MRHVHHCTQWRLPCTSSTSTSTCTTLLILASCTFLSIFFGMMHQDIQKGFQLLLLRRDHPAFSRMRMHGQTSTDDEMRKIHIAPVFGGVDLDPPYKLASDSAAIALKPGGPSWEAKRQRQRKWQQSDNKTDTDTHNDTGTRMHTMKHDYNNDAVFAIGNTMDYKETVLFVTTLRQSGFEGDIVLSTIDRSDMDYKFKKFLDYHSHVCNEYRDEETGRIYKKPEGIGSLITYEGVVRVEGTDEAFSHLHNVTTDLVYLRGLYRDEDIERDTETETETESGEEDAYDAYLDDARIPRSIGVARFELYWIWSQQYSPRSRIMIIDAHDSYFQLDGEVGIGVSNSCPASNGNKNSTNFTSELHLYEENQRKGKHRLHNIPNRTQMVRAYQKRVVLDFACNENILTPASVHGHQRAMEAYLRAMVKQFDYTQCHEYWCEWAFQNYLFYFGVLWSLPEVDFIKTHLQGTGAVNSIGQDIPLNQSGMFDYRYGLDSNANADANSNDEEDPNNEDETVYNRPMGNGRQPSWAVHQYKEDEVLYRLVNQTKESLVANFHSDDSHPGNEHLTPSPWWRDLLPIDPMHKRSIMKAQPTLGHHRRSVDAIFSMVEGNDLKSLVLFILSARRSGFQGDIVIHTPKLSSMKQEVVDFLTKQIGEGGLVLYEGLLLKQEQDNGQGQNFVLKPGFYFDATTKKVLLKDPRPPRSERSVMFELFSIWANQYDVGSRMLLIYGEISYFQRNPFHEKGCNRYELNVYSEHPTVRKFDDDKENNANDSNDNIRRAMSTMFTAEELDVTYKNKPVVTPYAIMGHRGIIQELVIEILNAMDQFCLNIRHGCDWAAINYLWHKKGFASIRENSVSYQLKIYNFGMSQVLLPMQHLDQMKKKKLFDSGKSVFILWDGSVSPVVLRYGDFLELELFFENMAKELLEPKVDLNENRKQI